MKPHLILTRFVDTGHETLGRLGFENEPVRWCTLEEPWNGNAREHSCIPVGEYLCRPRRFYHGGYDTFEITNVPDREYILIHRGNTVHDTEGCVLLGLTVGLLGPRLAVLNSKAAHTDFMERLQDVESFNLTIREVF